MKIFQFIGTRPELIKLAPLSWAADRFPGLSLRSFFTGQHVELVEGLAAEFDVEFRMLEGARVSDGSIAEKIANIVAKASRLIATEKPDVVVVQGDTISAFACGIAATYSHVPVAHIEAGLRTFDRKAPWPEENLRRQLTQIADFHFAPTEISRRNLLAEGIQASDIHVVGNTVVDAVCRILATERLESVRIADRRKFGILTMHRREMLMENGAANIIDRVTEVSETLGLPFLFPVHPSPMLREQLKASTLGHHIELIDPVAYPDFIRLLRDAALIITDSGGIQEEATFLKVPTICLRSVTERPEAVTSGAVTLVGAHPESLVSVAASALDKDRNKIAHAAFGTGESSVQILTRISQAMGL